jgi:hypothetical protein
MVGTLILESFMQRVWDISSNFTRNRCTKIYFSAIWNVNIVDVTKEIRPHLPLKFIDKIFCILFECAHNEYFRETQIGEYISN